MTHDDENLGCSTVLRPGISIAATTSMINNASPPAANVPHTRSSSRRSPDQSTAVSGEENGSNYPRGATAAKTTPALYHEVILPKPNRQYCDGGRSPDFGGDLVCSLAAGGKAWACGSRGDPGRSVPVFPMRCAGLSGTPFLPRRPYIPLAVSNCCTAQESSVARPRPLRRNTIMFPRVLRLRPAVFDSALQNGVSCRAGLVASQRSSTAMFSVCSSARRQQGDNTQGQCTNHHWTATWDPTAAHMSRLQSISTAHPQSTAFVMHVRHSPALC